MGRRRWMISMARIMIVGAAEDCADSDGCGDEFHDNEGDGHDDEHDDVCPRYDRGHDGDDRVW